MLANLKPYPEMKDSGVEWLGEVPKHWTTERLKSSVTNVVESRTERRGKDLYVALEHVESWTGRLNGAPPDVEPDSQLKRFAPGDVLFGKLRPYLAKVTRPTTGGLCVGEFLVLRPRDTTFDTGFLERLLRAKPIIDTVDASTFGAKMPRADWTFIGSMKVAQPPLVEQDAIVRFLHHVDRRIQRYIRAKEKVIALLEEQKHAIIHEAVTGRIDVRTGKSYPTYKPSGIDWLGKVPTHWEVRRLKSLVKRIDQGVSPQAENCPADGTAWGVLKAGCVNRGVFRESEHKRLPPDFVFDSLLEVTSGDVLVSRASGSPHLVGSVGRVSSLKHKLILSDKTFRPIFKQGIDPDFMVLAMNGRYYRQQVEQAISGAEGLANNLPLSSLRAFHLAVPGFDEQHDIVSYLRTRTSQLSDAATQAEQEADLLNEYCTRLIADVVTGKIDVREAAAALPEEAGLSGNGRAELEDDAGIQTEALEMTDWDTCPAVERKPGKVSGAWVFAGTRIPLSALYENLAGGATIDEFVEWFPGVDEQQVRAVLEHEAKALRTAAAP